MTMNQQGNNLGGIAAIQNVALCMQAMEQAVQRDTFIPGISAFYGRSGLGKSLAATYTAVQYRAYYVEIRSTWNRSTLLRKILEEMNIKPEKMLADMCDQVSEQLMMSSRPLILDEFDHLVKNSTIEIIRDIYESSGGAAILIIGEEQLETKLRQWERFHNRILRWQPAMPITLGDAQLMAEVHAPEITIKPDLLERVITISRGVARRTCINIGQIRKFALAEGLAEVDSEIWGSRALDSGDAPRRI